MSDRPYLTIDQVYEKLFGGPIRFRFSRAPLRSGQTRRSRKVEREEIIARRKEIRSAFDIVRYDPNEKRVARQLAGALGGSVEITETLMETVRHLNSERAIFGVQSFPKESAKP